MDAATDSKVEVKGSMNVSQDAWDAIFGAKEVSEETEEESENGR